MATTILAVYLLGLMVSLFFVGRSWGEDDKLTRWGNVIAAVIWPISLCILAYMWISWSRWGDGDDEEEK